MLWTEAAGDSPRLQLEVEITANDPNASRLAGSAAFLGALGENNELKVMYALQA